jgi:hypothetical protein
MHRTNPGLYGVVVNVNNVIDRIMSNDDSDDDFF